MSKSIKLVVVAALIAALIAVLCLFVSSARSSSGEGCKASVSEASDGTPLFRASEGASSECLSWINALQEEGKDRSFEWALKQLNNN